MDSISHKHKGKSAAGQIFRTYSARLCCFNADLTRLVDNLAKTFEETLSLYDFPQNMNYYQGSTTRERHLIPRGTRDKITDINVRKRQVGFHTHTHISESVLSDYQREKEILSAGDKVAGTTYLRF